MNKQQQQPRRASKKTAPFFRTDGTVDNATSIDRQSPELGKALPSSGD